MFLKNNFNTILKLILFFFLTISCQKNNFALSEGDIIFQDLEKENIDTAIKKVTASSLNYNFTHVAIVVKQDGNLKILEAISTGVQLTAIDTFLNRNKKDGKPKVVVGQLKAAYKPFIIDAITYGKTLIGLPYDNIYIIGDHKYYCSELLYEMFHYTNPEMNPFQLNPMTFKDSETNKTLEFWESYYKNLNHKIPEGELGINPNGMSVSPNIELVYDYFSSKITN